MRNKASEPRVRKKPASPTKKSQGIKVRKIKPPGVYCGRLPLGVTLTNNVNTRKNCYVDLVDFAFKFENFSGRISWGLDFWKSGDIEIRGTESYWKGRKVDMILTSGSCTDWELFKEVVEISAGEVVKKPFEEITGQDVKTCDKEDKECVICQDNLPQCANTGCGHKVFCITCANKFASGKENACPVCRIRIERLIRIY